MARPALSGRDAQNGNRAFWQGFHTHAETLAEDRVAPSDQLWMDTVLTRDRTLRLIHKRHSAADVDDADNAQVPWVLPQNMVSLNPMTLQEQDIVVHFGVRPADVINRLARSDTLHVTMEGASLFQQLLRDTVQTAVHPHFPVLVVAIELLEADVRGLGIPVALSITSEYTHASQTCYRSWCQGRTLSLAASSTASFTPGRGEVQHAPSSGGRTVAYAAAETSRCVSVDNAVVLGADAHYTAPRVLYSAPLDMLVHPGVRSLLSIDFVKAEQQFRRCCRNEAYHVVIGSVDDASPISESAWLALHMLHLARTASAGVEAKDVETDAELFHSPHTGSLKQLSLPATKTDEYLRLLEAECRPYELCLERNQGFRFSLSTLSSQWHTTAGATSIAPMLLLRLTYAVVPCSKQSIGGSSEL